MKFTLEMIKAIVQGFFIGVLFVASACLSERIFGFPFYEIMVVAITWQITWKSLEEIK